MKARTINIGDVFNRLTVLEMPISEERGVTKKRMNRYVKCACECGTITKIILNSLVNNKTKSCGCLINEKIKNLNFKHGEANKTKENRIWYHMISRCNCVTDPKWRIYGERGIKVCDRWLNSYELFLQDMGRCPESMSIDRINVNRQNQCQ